jgi:RNA recognition motif. (a.k.a. RRM, RBD, or RNP domain)
MPRHKQHPSHDILAGLRPRADPGTRWLARDGAVTTIRSKAVRFVTFEDTQDFANAHDITRNGVTRFVIENFTYTTTKEEVRQLFEPSGEVECINLMTDCVMMEPSFKMYDQCHPTGNDKSLHADRA